MYLVNKGLLSAQGSGEASGGGRKEGSGFAEEVNCGGRGPGRENGTDKPTMDVKDSGQVGSGNSGWKTGTDPTTHGHLSKEPNFGLMGIGGWHPSEP